MNTKHPQHIHYLFFVILLLWTNDMFSQDLFFSEYVEGTGNNKCIEIFNPTSTPIELTNACKILIYNNGATTPRTLSLLRGTIAPFGTRVICDRTLGIHANQLFTAGPNGNDAFVLECNGETIDVFGAIGCDPGASGWNVAGETTVDVTLRRKACVDSGTSGNGCSFPNSSEWEAFPVNTTNGLGTHEYGKMKVEILGNNALCENPSITLAATEGFVSYQWSNGSTGQVITVSTPGRYTVTAITAKGCKDTGSKIINGQSPEIFAEISTVKEVSCRPKKDGGFTVSPSGGSGGFSFEWETGAGSSPSITGLGAGNYNVTVSDNNGCTITVPVEVDGPITVPLTVDDYGETCRGRKDGQMILSAKGDNLQYSIDNINFSTQTVYTDLMPGEYPVSVIDESGCGDEKRILIKAGTIFNLRRSIITQAKCQGEGGGQIILRPEGGLAPYSVSFDDGPFVRQLAFSDLKADTFDIVIRDASGCDRAFQQEIEPGSDLLITGTEIIDATCIGINNGEIIIRYEDGSGRIGFNKRGEDGVLRPSFDPHIKGLSVGTHNIIVQDYEFDCRIPINFEIKENNPLLTNVVSPPPCSDGQKGSITILPQNGDAPYQYSLDSGSFSNSNTFTNLDSVEYVVTTKDNRGCMKVDSVNFGTMADFEITFVSPQQESCVGFDDGQITVATNSFDSVQYSIDGITFGGNNVFSGLAPNDYIIYVRSSGCQDTARTTILPATPIGLIGITPEISLCEGGTDGQLTVMVGGGKLPYSYQLDDGLFQTDNIFTNLIADVYDITVRDSNLCEQIFSDVILAEPTSLDLDCEVVQNVTTFEGMDGQVEITILGGTSPYNVQLVNAGFNNIISLNGLAIFNNLPAGDYQVQVSDKNDCTTTCSFTITQPLCDFSISTNSTNPTCYDSINGTITLALPLPNNSLTISWSDAQYDGQQILTKLAAGIYEVTVSDFMDCKDSSQVILIAPDTLKAEIIADNETICAKDTTQLALNAIYEEYFWSNNASSPTIAVKTAGTYQVTVKDSTGCSAIDEITINVIVQDTLYENRFTCDIANVGTFEVEERGIDGCTNMVFRSFVLAKKDTTDLTITTCDPSQVGILPTMYINTFGCDSLVITRTILATSAPTKLTATTCDSSNVRIDTFPLLNQFACDSLIIVNTTLAPTHFLPLVKETCNPQDTGLTTQFLINQFGCDSIIATQTNLATINSCSIGFTALADTICWGKSTGVIEINITTGNPPFDYFVLNDFFGDTLQRGRIDNINQQIDNIPIGQYAIILENSQNISLRKRVAVVQSTEINIQAVLSDYNGFAISCQEAQNGSINLSIDAGKAPYSFQWETGEQMANLQNLSVGNYEVTITDAANCSNTASFDLAAGENLTIDLQTFSPNCFGDAVGEVTIYDLPNANGLVEYSLDGTLFQPINQLPFTIEKLIPADYQLFIQDENDCQASTLFSIPMQNENQLKLGQEKNLILGDSLIIKPDANFEIDYFEWSANVPLNCADCLELKTIPTKTGQYTLTAFDVNGCSISAAINVNVSKETAVYIPNAFSPNADGLNDVYQIFTGNSVNQLNSLRIFDYEGRLMYQAYNRPPNDSTVGWDGVFNGQKMLPAVFAVFVEVELLDGTVREYSQTMTLVK